MPTKKQTKKTPWEIAKPILLKDYLEGRVTDSMKPKDVWNMKAEFMAVEYPNFRNNFARMKKTIKERREQSSIDQVYFQHDMTNHTLAKDSEGYWEGSEAQKLLRTDIENNQHQNMKPGTLWQTRPEYQCFQLKKFRGHIHQELRSTRETNYWIVKKKKKAKAEEAKRSGKKLNEEDMGFLYDPVLNM